MKHLTGIIAVLIACALGYGLGKVAGMGLKQFIKETPPNRLERRVLYLEDKVSQLEDRMDRAALGLTNVVYQPFGFRFEGPTNIVVISNVFHSYYPIKQLDRLFHADDKRFDKSSDIPFRR